MYRLGFGQESCHYNGYRIRDTVKVLNVTKSCMEVKELKSGREELEDQKTNH